METNHTNNSQLSIKDLYPELPEAQNAEAEKNLDRYLRLVLRICDRLQTSSPHGASLTDEQTSSKLSSVSNQSQ